MNHICLRLHADIDLAAHYCREALKSDVEDAHKRVESVAKFCQSFLRRSIGQQRRYARRAK